MTAVPEVTVVGSCNIDLVASCLRLPLPGETVMCRDLATMVGGKGANQAIAAARAGAHCSLIAAVGTGAHSDQILAVLRSAGVGTALVRTVAGPPGTALIMVDEAGGNLIGVVPGANAALTDLNPPELEAVAGAGVLILQLEIPIRTVTEAALAARSAATMVLLNAAPAQQLAPELLEAVDLLVANQSEAALLSGVIGDDLAAARRLLEWVPAAVVTLGAEGALYVARHGEPIRVAAPRVQPVDTTGAGDTFTGVLGAALGERLPVRAALERACAAASIAVESSGAATSIPDRAAIDARVRGAYGQP